MFRKWQKNFNGQGGEKLAYEVQKNECLCHNAYSTMSGEIHLCSFSKEIFNSNIFFG